MSNGSVVVKIKKKISTIFVKEGVPRDQNQSVICTDTLLFRVTLRVVWKIVVRWTKIKKLKEIALDSFNDSLENAAI